jgi:hypothetical protein
MSAPGKRLWMAPTAGSKKEGDRVVPFMHVTCLKNGGIVEAG